MRSTRIGREAISLISPDSLQVLQQTYPHEKMCSNRGLLERPYVILKCVEIPYMEGLFRIGGAILFGAVLIGGALFFAAPPEEAPIDVLSVVSKPTLRGYIPTKDSDGDGVRDWREELETNTTRSVASFASSTVPYVPPATLTDAFALDFFEHFVQTRSTSNTPSDQLTETLVLNQLQTLDSAINERVYRRDDVIIEGTTEQALVRAYGNGVGDIFKKHSIDSEDELVILDRAMQTGNAEEIQHIVPITNAYSRMLADLLTLPTPQALLDEHLALINALASIRNDLHAMEKAFEDPVFTLLHLERYQRDVEALALALHTINSYVRDRGITYTEDEGGIFFSIFTS